MIREQIQKDLKEALKEKKELELSVLRMLQSSIANKEKAKRYELSLKEIGLSGQELDQKSLLPEDEIMDVIGFEAKKRRESVKEFEKGSRQDLADKEKKELEVLEKYLPDQLPEQEVKSLVLEAVEKSGAKELKEMGKVMAELMPKIKGRADGNLVSRIVKEVLSSNLK